MILHACSTHIERQPPKTYPPKKPKFSPPRANVGDTFTIGCGSDRYGYDVIRVLDEGWCVVGQSRAGGSLRILRWIHTKGYWRICCCINDYERTKTYNWVTWGRADTYIDPHF